MATAYAQYLLLVVWLQALLCLSALFVAVREGKAKT